MDIFEAIEKRHSYRGPFTDQPVPRQDLTKIVQAALLAPSGKNCQTTRFVIIDDPELITRISPMHDTNLAMQQAKAYIACIIDTNPEPVYEGMSFAVEDCAIAVQNMLLAITGLGYAAVWIDGWLRVESRARKIADILSIPKEKTVRIILPIGVPAEQKTQPPKKQFNERAWFNKYGDR
ncbi:MAG: nitroreductase [Planctomycetes bacterium]|nr:nitroreductase [Planctomycetota bacterium]